MVTFNAGCGKASGGLGALLVKGNNTFGSPVLQGYQSQDEFQQLVAQVEVVPHDSRVLNKSPARKALSPLKKGENCSTTAQKNFPPRALKSQARICGNSTSAHLLCQKSIAGDSAPND